MNNKCIRNKGCGIWYGNYAEGQVIENTCEENGEYGIKIADTTANPTLMNNKGNKNVSGLVYKEKSSK
jgi:parallel beta-helix repeat protein